MSDAHESSNEETGLSVKHGLNSLASDLCVGISGDFRLLAGSWAE